MVGPIGVKKPKSLPPDLQKFIDSAGGDGFIIVSFGSYVEKVIAKEKIDMMATAFAKLKQKVLWRLKGKLTTMTSYNSYSRQGVRIMNAQAHDASLSESIGIKST